MCNKKLFHSFISPFHKKRNNEEFLCGARLVISGPIPTVRQKIADPRSWRGEVLKSLFGDRVRCKTTCFTQRRAILPGCCKVLRDRLPPQYMRHLFRTPPPKILRHVSSSMFYVIAAFRLPTECRV